MEACASANSVATCGKQFCYRNQLHSTCTVCATIFHKLPFVVGVLNFQQLFLLADRFTANAQVTEERLVSLLEQINEREGSSKPKITIQRRRPVFDDDD